MVLETRLWRRLLHLILIANVVNSVRCDMDPTQLIGTYENINPKSDGVVQCPDAIRVSLVETLQSVSGVLYVLPHRFISLPQVGGGVTECEGTAIDSPISTESATVLRRDTQTRLDLNDSLINEFALAQERFFIGVELGSRTCSLLITPSNTASVWMAPSREISVPFPDTAVSVKYQVGFKYVYYYSDPPCVFKGDARERGVVTPAPSMSSSRTPAPSQSRPPLPSPGGPSPSEDVTATVTASVGSSPNGASEISPYIPGPPPPISFSTVPQLSNSSDRVCFPADATVWVYYHDNPVHMGIGDRRDEIKLMTMKQLKTGYNVAAGASGERDIVIGFTHAEPQAWTRMVKLTTEDNRTLVASGGHFVYVHSRCASRDAGAKPDVDVSCKREQVSSNCESIRYRESRKAEAVKVGDRLIDAEHGFLVPVVKTERVDAKGLYNPQTYSGDIVVNGFVVTTFTTAVRNVQTGHALMAPWRLLERIRYRVGT